MDYWLTRLGIEEMAGKYPGQLSGGQRQRVAIARTLALHPSLLLMDEPFSALDSTTREDLQELMAGISEGTGMTTVLVTHDIQEAVYLGRKILIVGYPPIDGYMVIDNPEAQVPGIPSEPPLFRAVRPGPPGRGRDIRGPRCLCKRREGACPLPNRSPRPG